MGGDRHILLYVDNVDSHKLADGVELQRITIRYFMPNTTSLAQVGCLFVMEFVF